MRLLNVETLKLSEFFDHNTPPYAILSHTWGDLEVTFQDIQDLKLASRKKEGFAKIVNCCRRADRDGYEWVWIDTCCIDKSSSAELSEAINSMFNWYKNSELCYVYLCDVSPKWAYNHEFTLTFSRWCRRGWTLQELLAPRDIEFYASDWSSIGSKSSLSERLARITYIPPLALQGASLDDFTVAEKMSWAGSRETTRKEDRAYSLLGVFDINMPLLYGEGNNAFRRLQEQILLQTEDYTILLWSKLSRDDSLNTGILAQEPDDFFRGALMASPPDKQNEFHRHPWNLIRSKFRREEYRIVGFDWPIGQQLPNIPVRFEPPRVSSRGLHITLLAKREGRRLVAWTSCWITGIEQAVCLELETDHMLFRAALVFRDPRSMGDFEWLELCLPINRGSTMSRSLRPGYRRVGLTIHGVSCEAGHDGFQLRKHGNYRLRMEDLLARFGRRVGMESAERELRVVALRPNDLRVYRGLNGIWLPGASNDGWKRPWCALLLRSGPIAQPVHFYVLLGGPGYGNPKCFMKNACQVSSDIIEADFDSWYRSYTLDPGPVIGGEFQDRAYMQIGPIFVSAVVRINQTGMLLDISATPKST